MLLATPCDVMDALKGQAEFSLQREDATLGLKAFCPKIHLTPRGGNSSVVNVSASQLEGWVLDPHPLSELP